MTNLISPDDLEKLIRSQLASFYKRRIDSLDCLNLNDVLRRKNPYLFRANGVSNSLEMVSQLLSAHMSSSEENLFGEEFFEPICKALSGAHIAASKGVDFVIETEDSFEAISLKSGPNAFNSSQVAKQNQQFEEMEASLRATLRSVRKSFIPTMGCGYGKVDSSPTKARKYYKLAGQAFWEQITGDSDFYLKLIRLMKDDPDNHRPIYRDAWDRAINRFIKQFSQEFCDDDGRILWEELVKYNSGAPLKNRITN